MLTTIYRCISINSSGRPTNQKEIQNDYIKSNSQRR
ncbi:hypothetical protein bas03_0089 [Escherichia phage JulesPiccard]|uniref:Uncharacterized protein n=1 Tax=Escherichia phage JulesPiccard TaxID=2851956 RepID=A0AAE7VVJ1_9CAUD|nr:hypothetical protein bas03_0089 [Escherichia phage JulesPiccard]